MGQVYNLLVRSLLFIIYCVLGDECTGFWCRDLREKEHLEDLGVDGQII
jgi:hypothetical protein